MDFWADHPIHDAWELNDDLLGEDVIFVDVLPPYKCILTELRDMMVLVLVLVLE